MLLIILVHGELFFREAVAFKSDLEMVPRLGRFQCAAMLSFMDGMNQVELVP